MVDLSSSYASRGKPQNTWKIPGFFSMLHWNLPGTYKWLNPSHLGWVCPYLVTFYITTFQIIIIDQGSTTPISARKKKQQWTMARTKPCPDGFLIPFTVISFHVLPYTQKTSKDWMTCLCSNHLPAQKENCHKKNRYIYIYIYINKKNQKTWRNLVGCPSSSNLFDPRCMEPPSETSCPVAPGPNGNSPNAEQLGKHLI